MRENDILSIRPNLDLPVVEDTTFVEQFQNQTLRPILKLQHEIIIEYFNYHIKQRKLPFETLSRAKKSSFIIQTIQKDLLLKNQLLGIIIGHFTLPELHFYHAHESELSRRLRDLLTQRITSVFE